MRKGRKVKFQPKPVKMTRFFREQFNVTIFFIRKLLSFLIQSKICLNCLGNSSMIARISHNFLQTFVFYTPNSNIVKHLWISCKAS